LDREKLVSVAGGAGARPVLDWEGVPSISSTFADEFVGRLFVEIGPTGFIDRVRL